MRIEELQGGPEALRMLGLSSFSDRTVVQLLMSFSEAGCVVEVTLACGVVLAMGGVRRTVLPEFGASPPFLAEPVVSDVSTSQLEGIRWRFDDRDCSGFLCECSSIEVRVAARGTS